MTEGPPIDEAQQPAQTNDAARDAVAAREGAPAGAAVDQPPRADELSDADIERLRKMIGGKRDIADGAIPAILFVTANALWTLTTAALLAGAYGLGTTIYRLARKQDVRRALIGLISLAIAVGIAVWTGSASAYFVPGVVIGGLVGIITLLTVVLKQPTSSIFAMAIEQKPQDYYRRPEVLRGHMIVTTVWGLVFLARATLRAVLIANDEAELLAASAVVLGYPVTLGLAAGSVVYLRWRARRIAA